MPSSNGSRDSSVPSATTLHPSASTERVPKTDPVVSEKRGIPGAYDEKPHSSASSESYEDRGEHEVDDDGKVKRVKVVLEKRSGKELVTEIGQGPYTIPRW